MRKHTSKAWFLGALLCATIPVHAQYAWLDERGQRVYSDQPPPPGIPDGKILRAPHGAERAPADTDAPPATASKAPPSLADREADYRKRHDEMDKAAAKAASDKTVADNKRARCDAATVNKAQLDSGRRMRTEDRAVVTEDDKARQLANIDKVLKDCR